MISFLPYKVSTDYEYLYDLLFVKDLTVILANQTVSIAGEGFLATMTKTRFVSQEKQEFIEFCKKNKLEYFLPNEPTLLNPFKTNVLIPLKDNRRTGRSTRLIDDYIQRLFTRGYIQVYDHHFTEEARKDLFNRIAKRLELEHNSFYEDKLFKFDKEYLSITFELL